MTSAPYDPGPGRKVCRMQAWPCDKDETTAFYRNMPPPELEPAVLVVDLNGDGREALVMTRKLKPEEVQA